MLNETLREATTLLMCVLLVLNILSNRKAVKELEKWQAWVRRQSGVANPSPPTIKAPKSAEKSVVLMTDYRDEQILNEDFDHATGKKFGEEGETRE